MKKIIGILLTFLLISSVFIIINKKNNNVDDINLGDKITKIYALDNPDALCTEIGKNDKIKIGISSYYDNKDYIVEQPNNNSCNNTSFYNENLAEVKGDYTSWVWYGRTSTSTEIFVDDVKVKEKGTNRGNNSYFAIQNGNQKYSAETGILDRLNTLKPGEKIFIDIDIKDKNVQRNDYNDLRLSFNYALYSGDNNVVERNSVGYYLYATNGERYGPYKLYNSENIGYYNYINSSGGRTYFRKVKIISDNLFSNISDNITIDKVRIVPYEFYSIHAGSFKLYSISLDGYSNNYSFSKDYINVNNAEDKIRHNIVNNMMENATLKWNVSSNNTTALHFFHHYTSVGLEYNGQNGKVYYGIPYVNQINSTVNSFISQTEKNQEGFYSYKITDKYLNDATSTIGNEIKKGDDIGSDLYVYESNATYDQKTNRKNKLETYDYIKNDGYIFGQDCSSSTFNAVAHELPYDYSLAASEKYYTSNQVKILGNLSINASEVEETLRNNNIVDNNTQMLVDTYTQYYSSFIKNKYGSASIYNAYALLIPGDIVDKRGHVRMASGYSHVVCNDGTSTNKYTEGFCDSHDGINPTESYAILTEIGASKNTNHVNQSETGWEITLNPKYTDITNIDDLWAYTKETDSNGKEIVTYNIPSNLRSFNVNAKYTFSDMYGEDNSVDNEIDTETGMYLPFRYIAMEEVHESKNKIIKPISKFVLDKDYNVDERNNLLYDYLRTNKSLKGTFFTNYLIDGIRIDINDRKYYIYPNQTNVYSLYKDLTSEEVLGALNNLDYDEYNEVVISMDMGPNLNEVNNAMHADSEGYFEVLRITSPKELINESIESKDSNTVISDDKIDIKIPYNYTLTYSELNNKLDIVSNNIIIKNASGNVVTNNNEVLGTGSKIVLENSEYTIIIDGDINKDGKISSLDYIAVRNHLMQNKIINSSDVAYKAADINNDNKVSALDYVRIRTIMMEG